MVSPLDSIAQYIATDLAVGVLGSTVFENQMPDQADGSVDTCVAVLPLPGQQPELAVGAGQTTIDRPMFQVICRSLTVDTALSNDLTVFQGLHGLAEQDVHDTYFNLITAVQSSPTGLGRDQKQRFLFSRSYRAIVRGIPR